MRLLLRLPILIAVVAVWVATGPVESGAASTADRPDRRLQADRSKAASPTPALDTAWVVFGTDTVVAEVARSPSERADGLMYRDSVPDGTGMIFVYPDTRIRSFWMRNTYVALDIAYMEADFRIVDIQQLEPLNEIAVASAVPAQYALEVRQGWFAEKGIGIGATPTVVFGN